MSASPTAEPVLDLGSLEPERPHVRIDGASYRYRVDMDLNLVQLAKIERARERIGELYAKAEKSQRANPAQAAEVSRLISEGVGLVMYDPIPAEVLGKLNDVQRLAILDAFTKATLRAASRNISKARGALKALRDSISPPSSPASSGSTRRRARRSG